MSAQTFREWDRQQGQPKVPKKESIQCKSCSCEWFEQISVTKIDMNIICTLGQRAPEDNMAYSQILLRCVRCNDLQELPINFSGNPKGMQDSYTELTAALEKPVEKK